MHMEMYTHECMFVRVHTYKCAWMIFKIHFALYTLKKRSVEREIIIMHAYLLFFEILLFLLIRLLLLYSCKTIHHRINKCTDNDLNDGHRENEIYTVLIIFGNIKKYILSAWKKKK